MKIIVVDDELPIREWIRMMVQKADENLEVVACASSGEEAYKAFMMHKPELIISDIQMGNMDGIELLRRVKEVNPKTYFVLLTSHNDFQYARDGIRYGANEYILKTEVTVESIGKIIGNYESEIKKGTENIKKEYVEDVFGYIESNNVVEKEPVGIEDSYFAVCYYSEFDSTSNHFAFSEKIDILGNYFDKDGRQYFIFKGDKGLSAISQYNEAFQVAKNIASVYNIKVGFSGYAYGIHTAITKSKIALALTFYQEGNEVSTYVPEDSEMVYRKLTELQQYCIKEIYGDNKEKVVKYLEEILQLAKVKKFSNITILKSMLADILHAYKLSIMTLGQAGTYEYIDRVKNQLVESKSYGDLYQEISVLFAENEEQIANSGQYSLYTKKAIIFIKENYRENISLIDIVEKLNINSEYFCRVFKKETGKTFITYLTDYKIKKAQELLIKSDYSIQEISDKLGYSSVAYFSRVFKSKTGENPYNYRNK